MWQQEEGTNEWTFRRRNGSFCIESLKENKKTKQKGKTQVELVETKLRSHRMEERTPARIATQTKKRNKKIKKGLSSNIEQNKRNTFLCLLCVCVCAREPTRTRARKRFLFPPNFYTTYTFYTKKVCSPTSGFLASFFGFSCLLWLLVSAFTFAHRNLSTNSSKNIGDKKEIASRLIAPFHF